MAEFAGRDAVIVEAVRTPIGKGKANGALHDVLPVDLLAHSLTELVNRAGIDPALVDDVITGAVSQIGDQAVNIGRNALLAAGFPRPCRAPPSTASAAAASRRSRSRRRA